MQLCGGEPSQSAVSLIQDFGRELFWSNYFVFVVRVRPMHACVVLVLATVPLSSAWEFDVSPLPKLSEAFGSGIVTGSSQGSAPVLRETPEIPAAPRGVKKSVSAPKSKPRKERKKVVPAPASPTPKRRPPSGRRPDVCLAFLSCCGRTDLLEQTLHAAVRAWCHLDGNSTSANVV